MLRLAIRDLVDAILEHSSGQADDATELNMTASQRERFELEWEHRLRVAVAEDSAATSVREGGQILQLPGPPAAKCDFPGLAIDASDLPPGQYLVRGWGGGGGGGGAR